MIGTVTVTTDATGIFETTVTPAAGQEGLWSVVATDIEDICTDETGFLVVGAPATPSPSPSASPTPSPAASQLPNAATDGPSGGASGVSQVLLAAALALAAVGWTVARGAVARRLR